MVRLALILGTLISLVVPSAAQAKTITFSFTMQMVEISTTGAPGALGSRSVAVGIVKARGQTGAEIDRSTLTGHPTPTTWTAKATGVTYYTGGAQMTAFTLTRELRPDGSFSDTGSGRVTGGTGAYRGAKGTFTFTGTQPAGSKVASYRAKATLRLT